MQDEVLNDLQFSKFSNELDVAEHLPLGQVLSILFIAGDCVQLLILMAQLVPEKKDLKTCKYFFETLSVTRPSILNILMVLDPFP